MRSFRWLAAAVAFAVLACPTRRAGASPLRFVAVDDPIVAELRVLDLAADPSLAGAVRLAHPGAGPWQVAELLSAGPGTLTGVGASGIAIARLRRELERDGLGDGGLGTSGRSTPRLWQRAWSGQERAELSLGLEGERTLERSDGARTGRWRDGAGVHARIGLQVDRWLAYSHLTFGHLGGVGAFGDALVADTELAASTEESYIVYSAGRAWRAQLGRGRWAWGPGEAGSLLLSATAAPMNGLLLHLRLDGLGADAFILNTTVEHGTGEQLAAHRIEWAPSAWLRLGLAEAARYRAGGWQGVYLAGVIPYSVAQRLLDRERADTAGTLRNNVLVSGDVSIRVADGSRLYAELLVDDLHARTASVPNKYGWQAGWSGSGEVGGSRLTWNSEYTWLSRYVYTSYFGRAHAAQGEPLGFPEGPDSRTFRSRVTWDPHVDWQFALCASRTRAGEGGLAAPFVPGSPVPDVGAQAGVVRQARVLEGAARWWPASGVDLSVRLARAWIANANHVAGVGQRHWRGVVALRLVR